MGNLKRRILALVVSLCMVILPIGNIWGLEPSNTYVALGDSISTGYLLPNNSDSFVNKLANQYKSNLINLSHNGMDTTSLLALLNSSDAQSTSAKESIKKADLITVSIGGNHLLRPLMITMKKALGLSQDATTEQIQAELTKDPMKLLSVYQELQKPETNQLVAQELNTFKTELPQIIQKIKSLNSSATVIVQTLYNPFNESAQLKPVASLVEPFIQGLNTVINQTTSAGCTVADIYSAFKSNTSGTPLTNISTYDIHPNTLGHDVIFNTHKSIIDNISKPSSVDVQLLAGNDRYETAIKVSKERFKNGEANAVILVGKDAVVDGLASAPLAAQEKAPILFSDVNSLTPETLQEMQRVLGNDYSSKTVYIIGGESKISKSVESILSQNGVKSIERLAGEDRYMTSIAIAKKLDSSYEKVFVVGGNGEADAMSISAKASQLKSPIIVTAKDTLSQQSKAILANKQIDIIGGVNNVSEKVKSELQAIDLDKKVDRVAGSDRKETNGMVINTYYNLGETTQVYVAKDGYIGGNSKLVDALAAAPLAATSQSPIVLTTDGLTQSQQQAITSKLKGTTKLTQVGNGVSSSTIVSLVKLLEK